MEHYLTIREASRPEEVNRSPNWIRKGILLGRIKAVKFGNAWAIPRSEINRLKTNPIQISRKEMLG